MMRGQLDVGVADALRLKSSGAVETGGGPREEFSSSY